MSYLEELLPEFRKGAKIKQEYRGENYFIQLKDGQILDSYGSLYKFTSIDLLEDKWIFYQKPIDWDYIIENKCLCWFWDDERFGEWGHLLRIVGNEFITTAERGFCTSFKNCRPVHKDEVTFYEDRKDE